MSASRPPQGAETLLQRYGRQICHIRQRLAAGRLGLVLGAGSNVDFGFPSWRDLTDRIAAHPLISATVLLKRVTSHTSRSQLLFQQYRNNQRDAQPALAENDKLAFELQVRAGWQRIVHECLYDGVPSNPQELRKRHPYLGWYLNVIRQTALTVSYNFDNSLEKLLTADRPADATTKGHLSVWTPNPQLATDAVTIYHPNGFLPRDFKERASEHLVFLEDSFADQLIESMLGQYAALAHHFAQMTCLFIGVSLDDPTLKHLLRQNARLRPGHCHYYVAYMNADRGDSEDYRRAVADSNFAVYNLITLFLTGDELACLGWLLSLKEQDFRDQCDQTGTRHIKFKFYLTGAVGVGKTTAVAQFTDVVTYPEWLDERPDGMETDPELLDDARAVQDIDSWVAAQFARKNNGLRHASPGIYLTDRAPLDPLAFTPKDAWPAKAQLLRNAISPGRAGWRVEGAHIIFLIGDEATMAMRAGGVQKHTEAVLLRDQQQKLQDLYKDKPGVTVVDTRGLTIPDVARRVCEILHRQPYEEADLDGWLTAIQKVKQ